MFEEVDVGHDEWADEVVATAIATRACFGEQIPAVAAGAEASTQSRDPVPDSLLRPFGGDGLVHESDVDLGLVAQACEECEQLGLVGGEIGTVGLDVPHHLDDDVVRRWRVFVRLDGIEVVDVRLGLFVHRRLFVVDRFGRLVDDPEVGVVPRGDEHHELLPRASRSVPK